MAAGVPRDLDQDQRAGATHGSSRFDRVNYYSELQSKTCPLDTPEIPEIVDIETQHPVTLSIIHPVLTLVVTAGLFSPEVSMPIRAVVFFDWQNVYKRAREAFGYDGDASRFGQVDPVTLAQVLVRKHNDRSDDEADLAQVRIYRGRPTQQADSRGYAAFQRQASRWARNNKIVPRFNDLRYPSDWGEEGCDAPREKGIDVALAVDLVTMAYKDEMDLAIVMSADYDLVPAIQEVVSRRRFRGEGPSVEVASWRSMINDRPLRIRLQNDSLWCHWLDQQDYWSAEDDTDYNIPTAAPSGAPVPRPPTFR